MAGQVLKATTFKDSHRSFLEALTKGGVVYRELPPPPFPVASGITVEILIHGAWGALAVACIAWASARKSRKINVITKDNTALWLEGYSAKDAARILEAAKQIAAIDTKPDDESRDDQA
ncbi:MAG: hypothetical protein M3436_03945 [Pseudomonadota bacterium]|nr:hypothetical protein [Pseudomonadota bacterium]